MAGSQDAWRITGEDRSKHDAQFFQLKPVNGFVTGTQARDFFMQSGLPTPVLGQIWTLADMNGDGKMDKKEFSIAMHLIKKKLQGYELPKSLPASLKADPTPVIGSFAQPSIGGTMSQPMGIGFPMGGMPASMGGGMGMPMATMMQPQASLGTATMTTGSLGMGPRMANGAAGNFPPGSMGTMPLAGGIPMTGTAGTAAAPTGWAMPHNTKLKHTQTFNVNDRNKRGYLLGVEARAILMQSALPQPILAQIWTLSDIDRDGKLTCDEFCIAMHLSELARMGRALPATLPQELLPAKARSGSMTSPPPASAAVQGVQKDAFGDLLSSAGMPTPMPVAPAASQAAEEAVIDEQVTFEDKRKENFDKGQAELERRRAILREQQQKEEQARLEKERQEAEKRERQRQDAENRRQAELQRQLEKQREKERELEEQRRKMVEQREAARRELERQRQMEWEKQRKEQLMAEKQREYEQLSMLKSQMANLKNELESLDSKKAELSLKITQVQKGVTDFTTSIDSMRVKRDRTLADIDVFERQSTELNKKLSSLGFEKDKLNDHVQTAQATPLSDTHRTVMHSVEAKRASIQKLKKEVEQLESDTEARLGEIDCNNAELKNLKDQLAKLECDLPQLQKQHEEKIALQKKAAQELQQKQRAEKERQEKLKQEITQQQKKAPVAPASNAQPSWFDFNSSDAISSIADGSTSGAVSWDTAFAGTASSATYSNTPAAWGSNGATTAGGTGDKLRFRALYDFTASREDELSLVAGMEVLVLNNYTPVPGMEDWHKGESGGKAGWFPKAYVERLDEPSTDIFGSAFEPVVQSSTAQKAETSQQDLFSSQFSQASAISSAPAAASSTASAASSHIPAEGLLAKATYPWKARQETDLTFDKDDVILVKEQQDMKWFGELNGKSGWFPKAYVKLIGVAPKSGLSADTAATSQTKTAGSVSASPAPPDAQGEYYIAMYSYTSDESADLTFNEGDMIYVTAASGDWWTGTIGEQGKSGIFPANYVKKLDIQPSKASLQSASDSSGLDNLLGDLGSSSMSRPSSVPPSSSTNMLDNLMAPSSGEISTTSSSTLGDFDMLGMSFGGPASLASVDSTTAPLSSGSLPTSSSKSLDPLGDFDMLGMSLSGAANLPSVDSTTAPVSSEPLPASSNKSSDPLGDFDMLDTNANGAGILSSKDALTTPACSGPPATSLSTSVDTFGDFDMFDMSSGMDAQGGEPASSEASAAWLTTETKPTQSLTHSISSDGTGVSEMDNHKALGSPSVPSEPATESKKDPFAAFSLLATSATSSSDNDLLAGFTGLSGDQVAKDGDGAKAETPVGSGDDSFDPFGNMSPVDTVGMSSNTVGSTAAETKDDPFGGSDPFGNLAASPFGNEDPFAKEPGFQDEASLFANPTSSGHTATSAQSGGTSAANSFDLGGFADFGDFGITSSPAPPASSSQSLMDAFGGFGDFGMGDFSTNTTQADSGLPDILALEIDATQSGMQRTPSIARNIPVSGGQTISTVQVDLDSTRSTSGSKQAPPPPVAKREPGGGGKPPRPPPPRKTPEQKSVKKPEIARVIAPYVATGTGQLSLEPGNLINVRQKSPRGWWEGELQVRGQKKKIGWFPANYVKLLGGSSARSTPEPTASSTLTVGAQGSRSATPQSVASQDGVTSMNQPETVVALYAYTAQNDDELTFQKDAVITVVSRDNPDWWSGQLDGQTGVFPSNYVTPSPQAQSWMNDTQGALTKAERKRQQAIQELINTEESYNSDMQVALEVFKKPLMNGSIIPKEQVNQIFVNWEELIVCNKKLLQALRVRKKMCGKNGVIISIGDILCESLPHMNPYMRFCSCQLSAAATLQRVSESSQAFQEFHRSCMQNPKVKGVHVSGYLLKPMQRITRYPLLIEKILENTPTDHADRGNLEEALTLAQELCSQANQCVKEKQNSDCLEWIQARVHCDGLAENIIFNSLTNCLGPRRLLFHGVLYKAKSNKELVGFLFNDFLMLAQTSRPLGPSFSTHHLFDTATQCKMYRMPIFLNEVTVKKSTDDNEPCHFSITSDRILNLKAVSAVERDTWVREIEAASKQYKDKAKRKLERAHSVKRPSVGRILVVIQEACHLKASDSNGKSDPYCEVSMGSQEHRTKVIPGTLNPRWNASMQFLIRDVDRDTLCFTVYDRDLYSPNDFLGRTEVRIKDVLDESGERRGPITKRLILHEVETGEVIVKLDLQLYES